MRFNDTLRIVTRNLKRRKGRTILTAIGVTIGTASIVAMMSLAIGLKEQAVQSVSKFGNLTEIEVYPGYNPDNPAQSPSLDNNTMDKIRLIPGVTAVMPRVRFNGGIPEMEIGRKVGGVEVLGIDTKEARSFSYQLAEGKYLSGARNEAVVSYNVPELLAEKKKRSRKNKDNRETAPLQVPGSKEAKALRINPVNKSATLTINKMSQGAEPETRQVKVRIVGMLAEGQGARWGGGVIHLPIEVVEEMNKWAGTTSDPIYGRFRKSNKESYESLVVKVPERRQVEGVVEQIRAMGHNPQSPVTQLKEVNKAFLILQLVLGGIGTISLLVATIGIINTMVMSILERTREIGIMKVLGATIPNIRNMFLIEAGTIGFLGGVAGLIISYTIAGIVNLIFAWFVQQEANWGGPTGDIAVIPLWLAVFALAFASVVGVLAGIYPALRAARLSPLNAIRQE